MTLSLSQLLLGVWLILVGITWLGWVAISTHFLGLWAFVSGIVVLVETAHPLVIYRRQ